MSRQISQIDDDQGTDYRQRHEKIEPHKSGSEYDARQGNRREGKKVVHPSSTEPRLMYEVADGGDEQHDDRVRTDAEQRAVPKRPQRVTTLCEKGSVVDQRHRL